LRLRPHGSLARLERTLNALDEASAHPNPLLAAVSAHLLVAGLRRRLFAVREDGHYAGNEKMAAKVRDPGDVQTESTHPLVRTHPETGRKTLYISNHTQTLEGFKRAEARPILDFLMTHAVQSESTCRFRWEVGSLAMGQPLHPASRAQRLSGQAAAYASHHHRG
jgi:TfdA family taurine catabolism dioxygenase TauD